MGNPADAKTTGSQATTATAATGPSTTAAPTAAPTTTSTATATAAALTTKPAPNPADELKGKTLETIINEWNDTLEKRMEDFHKQAHKVSEWDKKIRDNTSRLLNLQDQICVLQHSQSELERNLEILSQKQNEFETLLSGLENDKSYDIKDSERVKGYKNAESLNKQLNAMDKELKKLIDKLNPPPDEETPFNQILQILNIHDSSLRWIDQNAELLANKINEVEKIANRSKAEIVNRPKN
uniref:Nucleoporin NSP1-like C-terminal domain-containing protein n=1 Tax=Arcella intermedia TaxID=1963864 RepID=A0A6B2L8T2_9EUKA